MENITRKVYKSCEWVMHLFLLQIYWLGGALVGGVLLGIVPSSIALFSAIRKLEREPKEVKLFSYFKEAYKTNFKNSLMIGLWYLLAVILGLVYSQFLSATTDSWLAYTHLLLYAILLLVFLLCLYVIPVYVHYQIPLKHLLPTAATIMLMHMKWNVPLLLSLMAVSLLFIRFSILFVFFGISLPAFIIFTFTKCAFIDFDIKRRQA